MAKEGAARKHLFGRSWKLIRNADVNILSSKSIAIEPIEKLNPFNKDHCAVVNSDPGCSIVQNVVSVAVYKIRLRVSVNTFASYMTMKRG